MTSKHNKKRNIGIIYELFLRHMSNCLIENNKKDLSIATKILEKRFDKNTQIYKEFRLFNALAKSNISGTEIAAAIITEAKMAAKRLNIKELEREKSALIKDINYKINDPLFYRRKINNYIEYANIQTLINEWQKGDKSNLKYLIECEKKVINYLLIEKNDEKMFSKSFACVLPKLISREASLFCNS